MALSWATIQVLAVVPSVPEGETKNLQYRLYWEAFPSSFSHFSPSLVCKQSLTSSCTHLTPNQSVKAHSAVGATSRGSRYREIVHHNGLCLLPAFSEPGPPPSCVSSHTSLMPPLLPFSFFECSGQSLGIFTLLLLLSTVLPERAGAHRKELYANKRWD